MAQTIEIYKSSTGAEIRVNLTDQTVWLDSPSIAGLFEVQRPAIVKHIQNIYKTGELDENSTCSILEQVAGDGKIRKMNFYNLDMIISVGYRVNSKTATHFRQWATRRLKDYLVQGYAINEKRLAEKQMQVETLKTGIRILHRVLEEKQNENALNLFAEGLALLDHYDHQTLDTAGTTIKEAHYPPLQEYYAIINAMKPVFASDVFAVPKDKSFESAVAQIAQTFNDKELYPSIEAKAATLLYLITKNHAFADGNKRIAAACFLYFLQRNGLLFNSAGIPVITNDALAALTLFVAVSKPEEKETVVRLIISVLNNKLK